MDTSTTSTESRGRSIFVPLSREVLEALRTAARRDDRTAKGEAAYLIRRALEADGLLDAERSPVR